MSGKKAWQAAEVLHAMYVRLMNIDEYRSTTIQKSLQVFYVAPPFHAAWTCRAPKKLPLTKQRSLCNLRGDVVVMSYDHLDFKSGTISSVTMVQNVWLL